MEAIQKTKYWQATLEQLSWINTKNWTQRNQDSGFKQESDRTRINLRSKDEDSLCNSKDPLQFKSCIQRRIIGNNPKHRMEALQNNHGISQSNLESFRKHKDMIHHSGGFIPTPELNYNEWHHWLDGFKRIYSQQTPVLWALYAQRINKTRRIIKHTKLV